MSSERFRLSESDSRPVPLDAAEQIKALRERNLSWSTISAITEVPRTTCYAVVAGTHQTYSNELTRRQRTYLLARMKP